MITTLKFQSYSLFHKVGWWENPPLFFLSLKVRIKNTSWLVKGLLAALLFGQEHSVDVRENTTGCDCGSAKELVELFVVADGKLNVAGSDTGLFVVAGSVAGELKDLSAEVLKDRGQVDWGTAADTAGVAALLQVAGHTADWELKSSFGRARGALSLLLSTSSLSFARHNLSKKVLRV